MDFRLITFSTAVVNPILARWSLGSPSVAVQFTGAFNSISWTNPLFENGDLDDAHSQGAQTDGANDLRRFENRSPRGCHMIT